jgi:methionyl-tRNA formyltransferase
MIVQGLKETFVSALRMSNELDAGPIYLKKFLSLEGLAEEVYIRNSKLVAEMIKTIVTENLIPKDQIGQPTNYKRRKPSQSIIPKNKTNLIEIFDHIRMLDAESYPKAFFEREGFRYEISRPALKSGEILADVHITKIEEDPNV